MFAYHTFTEAGGHLVNEDSFVARPHPADAGILIVALGDGQGGQLGGDRASALAVRTALETPSALPPERHASAWPGVLQLADRVVCDDKEAGYTTLIGLSVRGNRVQGASSGDSAALCIDGKGQAKELTRSQWKNPPVGSGGASFIPFAIDLVPPWTVLVMSDGVWKYVGWERLIEAAKAHRGHALVDE